MQGALEAALPLPGEGFDATGWVCARSWVLETSGTGHLALPGLSCWEWRGCWPLSPGISVNEFITSKATEAASASQGPCFPHRR